MEEENKDLLKDDQENFEKWNKASRLDFPRVMYCVGSIARIDNVIQNYYLNPFLLDIVGLKASYTGNVLLIKQIWDAITDPIIGYSSDQLNTRFGRRKPFIVVSAPFLWAAWILLWLQIDALESSQLAMFFYYLVVLLIFNLGATCQVVPYRALLQDIAETYGIRTKMTALSEMCAMFSFMIAVFVQGMVSEMFEYSTGLTNFKFGYIVCSLIFAPFIAFTRVVTSSFVQERTIAREPGDDEALLSDDCDDPADDVSEYKKKTFSDKIQAFLSIWLKAIKFRDFSLLALSWFLANVLLSTVTTNILLYVKYYLEAPKIGTYVILFLQFGIALSLPVWAFIIRRIGKKKSLFCGCILLSCFVIGLFFLSKGQGVILLILMPFVGCCAGSLYICLTAMQPDCVEAYYILHRERNEGVLYSLFLLGGKVGSAIALAVSSYVLALTGYVSAKDDPDVVQNDATKLALRVMVWGVPVAIMFLICFIVLFIQDYKKDFSTDRATVSGFIPGACVTEGRMPSLNSHYPSSANRTRRTTGARSEISQSSPASERKSNKIVRFADEE